MRKSVRLLLLLGTVILYHSTTKLLSSRQKLATETRRKLSYADLAEIKLPDYLFHLVELDDYFSTTRKLQRGEQTVTPFFFHVAKSAGTTLHDFYSNCFRLVTASEVGAPASSDTLEIVQRNGKKNAINVDISNKKGILHAKEVGLVSSHMAQLVISPLFYDATLELFTAVDKGVMFAMFRHPVKRIISLFYYLQSATWEPTYNPALKNMTIEDYADSPLLEANFITRSLVNKMEGPLSVEDLDLAKAILMRKCVVGIVDEFDVSIKMFNDAFGFRPNLSTEVEGEDTKDWKSLITSVETCTETLKNEGGTNKHTHAGLDETSEAYKTIERKNGWDMLLWEFIVELHKKQRLETIARDLGFKGFFKTSQKIV